MKLQTKILIPIVGLIFLLTVSLSLIYLWLIGGTAIDQFRKHGESLTTNLASGGKLGVLMRDSSQLASVIETAFADEEVRYVAFYDDKGKSFALRGEVVSTTDVTIDSTLRIIRDADVEDRQGRAIKEFTGPVYSRGTSGDIIGAVKVGISMEQVLADRRTTILWSAVLSLIFSLGAVIGVLMIMRVVRPLIEGIKLVSTGDLTLELHQNSNDEIGGLIENLGNFVRSLRSNVEEVQEATVAVTSYASHIRNESTNMAQGASEQTQQISTVAGAVKEMMRTIQDNSRNATTTLSTARGAKESAEQGGKVVKETVEGMKRIAGVVKKSSDTIQALGKSSKQIGEIVSVINEIADQTNLLALNAAIEAARAGEQGRGFAVVADEVRKLAERTTKATKEIATMIKSIQKDTEEAVYSMSEGTREVDNGISLADKAGVSLKEIMQVSQRVADMVTEIAAASEEQSKAGEEISNNVESINELADQTAARTLQVARSAEDLDRLTETLRQVVSQFKFSREKQLSGLSALPEAIHEIKSSKPEYVKLSAGSGKKSLLAHHGNGHS